MPQIPDDEIPEVSCHGVARWSYTRKRIAQEVHINRNIKSVM